MCLSCADFPFFYARLHAQWTLYSTAWGLPSQAPELTEPLMHQCPYSHILTLRVFGFFSPPCFLFRLTWENPPPFQCFQGMTQIIYQWLLLVSNLGRWVSWAHIFSRPHSADQQVKAPQCFLVYNSDWDENERLSVPGRVFRHWASIFIFHTSLCALRQLNCLYSWKIPHITCDWSVRWEHVFSRIMKISAFLSLWTLLD